MQPTATPSPRLLSRTDGHLNSPAELGVASKNPLMLSFVDIAPNIPADISIKALADLQARERGVPFSGDMVLPSGSYLGATIRKAEECCMKFFVNIIPHIPPELSDDAVKGLLARETDAAIKLMEQGILLEIHRVAGRGGNVSLWETETAEQLDQVLNGLPMARYISFEVTPLIKHRVQIAYEERRTG